MMENTVIARKVSGKQRKNPDKTWEGLAINATVEGVMYSGVIFPERTTRINSQDAIVFHNTLTK
jgi:hypothetical protein